MPFTRRKLSILIAVQSNWEEQSRENMLLVALRYLLFIYLTSENPCYHSLTRVSDIKILVLSHPLRMRKLKWRNHRWVLNQQSLANLDWLTRQNLATIGSFIWESAASLPSLDPLSLKPNRPTLWCFSTLTLWAIQNPFGRSFIINYVINELLLFIAERSASSILIASSSLDSCIFRSSRVCILIAPHRACLRSAGKCYSSLWKRDSYDLVAPFPQNFAGRSLDFYLFSYGTNRETWQWSYTRGLTLNQVFRYDCFGLSQDRETHTQPNSQD